jgi:two-component system, OmpR family, sensor kinase
MRKNRWYRSFYWRIGVTFVLLVVLVILAQGALSTYLTQRPNERSPNNLAAVVAADVASLMTHEPARDLNEHLHREYTGGGQRIYVVLKDGRLAANTSEPLEDDVRRSMEALLHGVEFAATGDRPSMPTPLIVTAPVQVRNELRGIVVLPPPVGASPLARSIQRLVSLPGTAILIIATLIAAPLVFGPARRRLRALEAAAERLGAGDLTARAPETGEDEIARLAAAFNRMAQELDARDSALRTSDRLRRHMLADVSHELRTPLTTMMGYLDTLRMPEVSTDAETRERYLATVQRETRRLDRLVRDLLALARLQNDAEPLDTRFFAIRQVFAHVVARHEQETRTRHISVPIAVDDAVDQVFADPDRLAQVIENLFANALRHTPDGGAIELAAVSDKASLVLTVTDTGEGIPPEHLPHVFDRFYKVDPSRMRVDGGSGLGLSIAKAIVERHAGTMHATSANGRTVFTIVLPGQIGDALDVGELVTDTPRGE